MKYRKGYKYQLAEDITIKTKINGHDINSDFIRLVPNGALTLKKGYACDGPSGPTIDTRDFMRGSFFHDALYQMMREEWIPVEYKGYADILLKELCIEDGMPQIRADYVYFAVNAFGGRSVKKESKRKIYET